MDLVKVSKNNIVSKFLLNFISRHTREAYRKDLMDFFSFANNRNVQFDHPKDIKLEHFIAYREYLQQVMLRTPNTINRKISSVKSLLNWCISEGLITHNPASALRLPKATPSSPTVAFSDEEVKAMLRAPNPESFYGNVHRMILACLLLLGLRRSELANIKLEDMYEDRGHKVLKVIGKGEKVRYLPLNENIQSLITTYLNNYEKFAKRQLDLTDYLLQSQASSKNTKPMNPNGISRIVSDYAKKLNINKRISAHSCRATVISHLLEIGESPRNVADFAGHSSIKTTVDLYDKKRDNLDNSSAYKVNYGG